MLFYIYFIGVILAFFGQIVYATIWEDYDLEKDLREGQIAIFAIFAIGWPVCAIMIALYFVVKVVYIIALKFKRTPNV